jgi:hypothetical protein
VCGAAAAGAVLLGRGALCRLGSTFALFCSPPWRLYRSFSSSLTIKLFLLSLAHHEPQRNRHFSLLKRMEARCRAIKHALHSQLLSDAANQGITLNKRARTALISRIFEQYPD